MNAFQSLIDLAAGLPDLVTLLVCPALLLLCAILFALLGKKRYYPVSALFLGGIGGFLVSSKSAALAASYLLLFLSLAALFSLFLFLPPIRKKGKEAEALYEKFALPLEIEEREETEETEIGEEPRLLQAQKLLEALKKSELEASDRLEIDEIEKKVLGFSGRMTEGETRSLNDCLATILKLTAKYQL